MPTSEAWALNEASAMDECALFKSAQCKPETSSIDAVSVGAAPALGKARLDL